MHITIGIVHSIHTVWLSNRGYIKVYLKRLPRLRPRSGVIEETPLPGTVV